MFSTAEQVAAETGVSSRTVKRNGKFADEVAKAAYHSHGTSGRAHGDARHHGLVIRHSRSGDARA